MSAVIHFIASLLVFNRLTVGRAQFGFKGVRAVAKPEELAVIGPFLDEAAEQARVTRRMNRAWRAARKLPKGRTGVQVVDSRVDGALGSVIGPIDRAARFLPEGHPIKKQAADLLKAHVPDGVGAITSLPYEEELDEAEALLEALSAEALEPLVKELGLGVWLEVLRDLLPEYDAAVRVHAGRPLTYAQVRAARADLQEAIARVRVVIMGHWPRANEAEIRDRLLAPLQQQSDDVGEAVRQQVRTQDVHPDSGKPVESDEDVEAEGGAPA